MSWHCSRPPFVNGTGDPDSDYPSDGITESVINNLSQLRTLRVTARNATTAAGGNGPDLGQVAQPPSIRCAASADWPTDLAADRLEV
jgi:TolB-like protein